MNGKGRTGGLWGVVVQGGKINAVVGRNTKTEPKQVKEVNLSSNGLDGYIPMSIGAIDSLEHLKLAYNPKLVGVIPETIGLAMVLKPAIKISTHYFCCRRFDTPNGTSPEQN
jgi:hypothetical protein